MDYNEVADLIRRNSGTYEITTPKGVERRRLFLTASREICEFAPRSRCRGFELGREFVSQWLSIKKVKRKESNIVAKFQKYAARATFPSEFIRKCLDADISKSCYENGLTTGTRIDGDIISLKSIERFSPWSVNEFRKSLKERRNYHSGRFDFRGYDGSLWIEVKEKDGNYYRKGDVVAGFSKEYRGCGNGYYYFLIDDEHFIGCDID